MQSTNRQTSCYNVFCVEYKNRRLCCCRGCFTESPYGCPFSTFTWAYNYMVKCHTDKDSTFSLLILGSVDTKECDKGPIWCLPSLGIFLKTDAAGSILIFNPCIQHCQGNSFRDNRNTKQHFGLALFCSDKHINLATKEKGVLEIANNMKKSLKERK